MAILSLESGGCIKIDLKAYNEKIHIALCGVSNKATLANFRILARIARLRKDPPLLIASTLLVPGYVDEQEVGDIARFIASIDPHIPYTLLAFSPAFVMNDLPPTSKKHALACFQEARNAGLFNIHLGNTHLLW